MKLRTKKKTVEQKKKNRNRQKTAKSVRLMGMAVCGGKDIFSSMDKYTAGNPRCQ